MTSLAGTDLSLIASPNRLPKPGAVPAEGKLEYDFANHSVVPADAIFKKIDSSDPKVATVTANAAIPTPIHLPARPNRYRLGTPSVLKAGFGKWASKVSGPADLTAEFELSNATGTLGTLTDSVTVTVK